MGIFTLGVRAQAARGLESNSYWGRFLPLAGSAEVTCLEGCSNLRPDPPECAGDTSQRVGQRAACGLGAVLASYLHGECRQPSRWGPPRFP